MTVPDAHTPIQSIVEPFPIMEQSTSKVTFGQIMANREFWRETAHNWQCQFTQANTELKVLKDHHSALIKEKNNVVQAQLAQNSGLPAMFSSLPELLPRGGWYW